MPSHESSRTDGKVTVKNTSTKIVDAYSSRYALVLTNDSANTIYLAIDGTAAGNEGIRLNANGGAIILTDFSGAVHGIAPAGDSNICVAEY